MVCPVRPDFARTNQHQTKPPRQSSHHSESKFVKDLDKFDMILQAYEYEKGRCRFPSPLCRFFSFPPSSFVQTRARKRICAADRVCFSCPSPSTLYARAHASESCLYNCSLLRIGVVHVGRCLYVCSGWMGGCALCACLCAPTRVGFAIYIIVGEEEYQRVHMLKTPWIQLGVPHARLCATTHPYVHTHYMHTLAGS